MKLAIFDKDGTLTTPKSGANFVQNPEDQVLLPGVAEGIAALAADGWALAIASNQGGVAAGYKSVYSAIDEMLYAMDLSSIDLAMAAHSYENEYGEAIFLDLSDGGRFWEIITNRQRKFRKPNEGMIDYLASTFYGSRHWMPEIQILFVGDRPEDQQAAAAAGVPFQWADEWRATHGTK
jgi:D-glycero-D-manno-heptose 1,7-bisphosphate phosphatase